MATAKKIEFELGNFPIKNVTVYQDRAQIKRTLETELSEGKSLCSLFICLD